MEASTARQSGKALISNISRCIELGSGTGLAGLAAAQCYKVRKTCSVECWLHETTDTAPNKVPLQTTTILTDIESVMPSLRRNIQLNPHLAQYISAMVLDWNEPERYFEQAVGGGQALRSSLGDPSETRAYQATNDCGRTHDEHLLALAADCVWTAGLLLPFTRTLKLVCQSCTAADVLFAHKERSRIVDELMLSALHDNFNIEAVPELPGERRGSIKLWRLTLHN
jgi:hypothetical protein